MGALPHLPLAEMNDEREPETAEAQVGESLRFERAVVGDGRLALHDDTIVDQQVQAKVGGQLSALVHERHGLLAVPDQPSRFELEGKRLLVHGLEQPWPSQSALGPRGIAG